MKNNNKSVKRINIIQKKLLSLSIRQKFISFFYTILFIQCLSAQINKGDILIYAGSGIEYYQSISYNYKIKINNSIYDTSLKDDAGNYHWVFGADYAFVRWFSSGLKIKINKYITDKNTNNAPYTPSANSTEIILPCIFRAVNTRIFFLILSPEFGYSSLIYKTNNPNDNIEISGKGGYFSFNIQPSFIFKNLGFYGSIFFPRVFYNEMKINQPTFNDFVITKWYGKGLGFQFGIHYRIRTKRQENNKEIEK